jgi:hypothetical protein
VRSPEEDSPGNAARVLALEEERLGLAILESEDLAVTADVELALIEESQSQPPIHSLVVPSTQFPSLVPESFCGCAAVGEMSLQRAEEGNWARRTSSSRAERAGTHLARVDLLAAEGIEFGSHFGGDVGCGP